MIRPCMGGELRVCIDRPLPLAGQIHGSRLALDERIDNAPLSAPRDAPAPLVRISMALETNKRWKPGRELRVRFVKGTKWQRDAVAKFAVEWCDYANVGLTFGSRDRAAELRVGFEEGDGSWSRVGTDALADKPNVATMNLGWVDREHTEEEVRGVILHEFGHALGCIHEHQSPAAKIRWNKEKVYAYYQGYPNHWTPEETDFNVLEAYSRSQTKFTAYDPESIMIYAISAEFTTDGYHVDENHQLSDGDRAFIARNYPGRRKPVALSIGGRPKKAKLGAAVEEDHYTFRVPKPGGRFAIETSGPTNVRMALYGPDDQTRLVDHDDDSGRDGYNARIETVLMAGRYLLRVQHQEGKKGSYGVGVTQTA